MTTKAQTELLLRDLALLIVGDPTATRDDVAAARKRLAEFLRETRKNENEAA